MGSWIFGQAGKFDLSSRTFLLVPRMAVERAIPRLVAAFDGVEDLSRQTWQTALQLSVFGG